MAIQKLMWGGKPIESLSHDELVQIVYQLTRDIDRLNPGTWKLSGEPIGKSWTWAEHVFPRGSFSIIGEPVILRRGKP